MTEVVAWHRQGRIGIISIDNPPVNALSLALRQGLANCVEMAVKDESTRALVLICKGRTFIAGADISEFGKPPVAPHLPDVLRALERCPKPIVAALHGTVLGGGFETALACHYRVAKPGTRVGFPEVRLGLIPGAGGTQLLPRVAGLENALDMISSGRHVILDEALEMGLVDAVVEVDLLAGAIEFAERMLDSGQPLQRISEMTVKSVDNQDAILSRWQEKVARKTRGQDAPLVAIKSIANATRLSFEDGLRQERALFVQCRASEQSKALRHIFFAERQAAKTPGIDRGLQGAEVSKVAVIGAGTMGRGIGMCFANAGTPVHLLEIDQENLQAGFAAIAASYRRMVESGRIDQRQSDERRALITGSCDYADLADMDLVIEAAFEDMDVKQGIFGKLDRHCRSDAVLATNTSYLDIDQIASAVAAPERVLGMHFFSPAPIMKLLEVVAAQASSPATIATALNIGKRLGKTVVVVKNCFGFAGNRMYSAYQRAGQMLLLEGATPRQLDSAMQNWGMAMGPAAVMDMSGLDIGYKARKQNPNPPDEAAYFRPANMLVEHGFLGRKSGRGFYRYEAGPGSRQDDEEIIALIRAEAECLGVKQRNPGEKEIQRRMIHAVVSEGNAIVAEGIANRPGDLDVIWVNGYGFPRWRGGPMYFDKLPARRRKF